MSIAAEMEKFEKAKDASAEVQAVPMDQSLEIEEKLKHSMMANRAAQESKRHLAKVVDKANRLALAAAMATNSSNELAAQCRELDTKEEVAASSDVQADKKLEVVADEEELESNTQTVGGKPEGLVTPDTGTPTPDFKKKGNTFNVEKSSDAVIKEERKAQDEAEKNLEDDFNPYVDTTDGGKKNAPPQNASLAEELDEAEKEETAATAEVRVEGKPGSAKNNEAKNHRVAKEVTKIVEKEGISDEKRSLSGK